MIKEDLKFIRVDKKIRLIPSNIIYKHYIIFQETMQILQ